MQEILPIAATGRKMDRNSCNQPHLTPVRRIKSTRRSLSGVYAFRGNAVAYESTLERDFLQRIDFNRNVVAAVSQPVSLDFVVLNGRSYTYTPDFLVYFKPDSGLRPMLVEVKPEEQWRAKWREDDLFQSKKLSICNDRPCRTEYSYDVQCATDQNRCNAGVAYGQPDYTQLETDKPRPSAQIKLFSN